MNCRAILAVMLLTVPVYLLSLTTWVGKVGRNWSYPGNWDTGVVPDSTTDVVIPAGTEYSPEDENSKCRDLTIDKGATMTIRRFKHTVMGDLNCSGMLVLGTTRSSTVSLIVKGDINFLEGSKAIDAIFTQISCYGNMMIAPKAEIMLSSGSFSFAGPGNSTFTNHSSFTRFSRLNSCKKTPGSFTISEACTKEFSIGQYYSNAPGCLSYNQYNGPIFLYGGISDQNDRGEGGGIMWDAGALVMINHNASINIGGKGSYLHDLYISGIHPGKVILCNDLKLMGIMAFEGVNCLDAGDKTLSIAGDWINRVGESAFSEGTSTVRFIGNEPNSFNLSSTPTEVFYNLEIDKPEGRVVIDNGAGITCQNYNWTSGGIEVVDGSFTALNLVDKGIWGDYTCSIRGRIDLNVDDRVPGSADICGKIDLRGGIMTIKTGNALSSWPGEGGSTLLISRGILFIDGKGINILAPSDRRLSYVITGGTIRTSGDLVCKNPEFNPSKGHVSLTGSENTLLDMQAGSLNHLIVSKTHSHDVCELGSDLICKEEPTLVKGRLDLKGFSVRKK